jgi:predicted ATPase
MLLQEEAARRLQEERMRAEEERRRMWEEEQRRREEEDRMRQEQMERFMAEQQAALQRQKQQLAAEQLEIQRQQAWMQYNVRGSFVCLQNGVVLPAKSSLATTTGRGSTPCRSGAPGSRCGGGSTPR